MTPNARKYTIGRAPSCDIVLADESVSRLHAELTFLEEGKLLVTDCRSTQGTSLMQPGGKLCFIRQERVSPQDTLCFGTVAMQVKELLQAIHLKYPPAANGSNAHIKSASCASMSAEGAGLVRCECGAVKVRNNCCGVCGT